MDLSVFTEDVLLEGESAAVSVIGPITGGTTTIVGACKEPFSVLIGDAPFTHQLLPQLDGQCLLLHLTSFLEIRGVNFWIHNIYLRSVATRQFSENPVLYSAPYGQLVVASTNVWLSRMTFQGELPPSYANVSAGVVSELALRTHPISMGSMLEPYEGTPTKVFITGSRFDALLGTQRSKFGSFATSSCIWTNMLTPVLSSINESPLLITNATFFNLVATPEADLDELTAISDPTGANVYGDSSASEGTGGRPVKSIASSSYGVNGTFLSEEDRELLVLRTAWDNARPVSLDELPDYSTASSFWDDATVTFDPEKQVETEREVAESSAVLSATAPAVASAAASITATTALLTLQLLLQ